MRALMCTQSNAKQPLSRNTRKLQRDRLAFSFVPSPPIADARRRSRRLGRFALLRGGIAMLGHGGDNGRLQIRPPHTKFLRRNYTAASLSRFTRRRG